MPDSSLITKLPTELPDTVKHLWLSAVWITVVRVHSSPQVTMAQYIAPVIVAFVFIAACSLFKEPSRRNFSAIMMAGAGAAYLNGGLGIWEFVFCVVITAFAYWGLNDYRWIGAAWILHTIWDIVHHFYGNPIVPFVPASSAGCAICDPVLAIWYFLGAPSILSNVQHPRPKSA